MHVDYSLRVGNVQKVAQVVSGVIVTVVTGTSVVVLQLGAHCSVKNQDTLVERIFD